MNKILLLYNNWSGKCITGGQFYEENMYQCIRENKEVEVERFSISPKRNFLNKLFAPLYNLRYYSFCKRFDLVIFNSVTGWYFIPLELLLKLFSKTKVAVIHHHFLNLEFTGIKKIFYKILENSFLHLSKIIITVSPYIYDLCKRQFGKKDIRYWPIPFSDKNYYNEKERSYNQLIFIGTIEPRKGLIYAISALKMLSERDVPCNLKIVGKIRDQRYYQGLCSEISKNKLNVDFCGFVDVDEKNKLLLGAKLFIFPSLLEGYGMVLREAMSYGLPIVCFNNSAMPYLVKHDINGKVVENKNSIELANAIEELLENEKKWEVLSTGAYNATKNTITPVQYKELLKKELRNIL